MTENLPRDRLTIIRIMLIPSGQKNSSELQNLAAIFFTGSQCWYLKDNYDVEHPRKDGVVVSINEKLPIY